MRTQMKSLSKTALANLSWRQFAMPILVFSLLLFITAITGAQQSYRYRVRGRVIDKEGQPVPHAKIIVDAGLPKTWEDSSYGVESDQLGNFVFYDGEESTPAQTRLMFVTGPVPETAFSPVDPPFNRLAKLTDSKFSGRRIAIKKNGEIDIGNVPIQVSYGVVRVFLRNRVGKPLLTDTESWRYVWFRIRNNEGKLVIESSISINKIAKAVDLSRSSVDLALPEGRWDLEISQRE